MSTGIETWNVDLWTIGPMYPFVGSEHVLVLIGLVTWIAWHILQARGERSELAQEKAKFSDGDALAEAMEAYIDYVLREQVPRVRTLLLNNGSLPCSRVHRGDP